MIAAALLLLNALASARPAEEFADAVERGRGDGSIGVVAGVPQLAAVQLELPQARDLDVALHAGTLLWLGSAGARLRWRCAEAGWHPYLFGGVALVSVLIPTDAEHESYLGFWPGVGVEWRGSRWKWQAEVGLGFTGSTGMTHCFAVGVARLR